MENTPPQNQDANFVSVATAAMVAKHTSYDASVSKMMKNSAAARRSGALSSLHTTTQNVDKEVESIVFYPDKNDPSLYVFNYKGGGYVVIPADKRVEPILAYAEEGSLGKLQKGMPDGLIAWFSTNNENMHKLRARRELTAPEPITKQWKTVLPDSLGGSGPVVLIAKPPVKECSDSSWNITKGPLLATQWGQAQGFNDLCPAGNYDGGHVPAGCVATSMGQIMAYWKYPASYSWSSMPANSGNYEVSRLLANIGTSVSMVYADSGSGANINAVVPSFINSFGYGSASHGGYNFDSVTRNIDAGMPVILSGDNGSEGHAWVCDGYIIATSTYCPLGSTTALYLHMNWGWNEWFSNGNNYNGWFRDNNWAVTRTDGTFNFQYNTSMVYNIHP